MKRVLCFGDSLTYGQVPGTTGSSIERYDETIRWTSLLGSMLGKEWQIIEEGLPSRTIDKEDPRPGKRGRNASLYISPCLESHIPIEHIVIWLGTNDIKLQYGKKPNEIVTSMQNFIEQVKTTLKNRNSSAKIILVAPPPIDDTNHFVKDQYYGTGTKLKELAEKYEDLAHVSGLAFINLFESLEVPDSPDGTHLTEKQNRQVAEIFCRELTSKS